MKNIFYSITKNFTALFIAQFLYKLSAFFAYALIAKYLGVLNFGQLSFALSFVGLFNLGFDFGLSELLIRDAAGRIEELSQKYISNILSIKLIFSFFTYLLLILIGLVSFKNLDLKLVIIILGISLTLDSFTLFFRSIFRLFEKMEIEALSLISEGALKLIFVFIALKVTKLTILNVAYIFLITSLIVFTLTMIISILKFAKLRFDFDYLFMKKLLKKTVPFAFLVFFGVINFKITTIMVSYFIGDTATGLYSAAIRLIEPILIIPVIIAVALFPTLSRIYKESIKTTVFLYKKTLKILFISSIFIIVTVNIFAEKIVIIIFGREYLNSILLLRMLSLSLITFFPKFLIERMLLILGRPKIVISSYIMGTLITLFTGITLVIKIGFIGIGIAFLLSEFFIVGYNFVRSRRYLAEAMLESPIYH